MPFCKTKPIGGEEYQGDFAQSAAQGLPDIRRRDRAATGGLQNEANPRQPLEFRGRFARGLAHSLLVPGQRMAFCKTNPISGGSEYQGDFAQSAAQSLPEIRSRNGLHAGGLQNEANWHGGHGADGLLCRRAIAGHFGLQGIKCIVLCSCFPACGYARTEATGAPLQLVPCPPLCPARNQLGSPAQLAARVSGTVSPKKTCS